MSGDSVALYPWQQTAWQQFADARLAGRLGHAFLLHGRVGSGKQQFALRLAGAALCQAAARAPCGVCQDCVLLAAGNHPDFSLVAPAPDKTGILIDQIRTLIDFFSLTSHYGRAKVALITPADGMNRATANALLKVLEEPPDRSLLLLVTARPDLILPTLRSRCQQLALDHYARDDVLAWLSGAAPDLPADRLAQLLALGGRAPLGALAARDADLPGLLDRLLPLMIRTAEGRVHASQAAEQWGEVPLACTADLMQFVAHALVTGDRACLPAAAGADVKALADGLHSAQIFGFVADLLDIKRLATAAATLRQTDLLDNLWLAWTKATRTRRKRA